MTCSTCGQPGHNSRGYQKSDKGKQPKGGGKTKKRPRSLIDEDSDESMARSIPSARLTIEEELHLTSPQPSQLSQASQSSSNVGPQYRFMPTPSVPRKQSINSASIFPDFDYPEFDNPDPF